MLGSVVPDLTAAK